MDILQEENSLSNAWKLLAKGPSVPHQKLVPFQTKIQRHYPQADQVPYAGKTTQEIILGKDAFKRLWEYPPKTTISQVSSSKGHFECSTIGSQIITSPKRQSKRLSATRNRDSQPTLFAEKPINQRPAVRLAQGPREASSEQVHILLQSQDPPFFGGHYKPRDHSTRGATAGNAVKPEELIAPPEKICPFNKRPSPVMGRQTTNLINHGCDDPDVTMTGKLLHGYEHKNQLNVFNYPLPSSRSKFYTGCIERTNTASQLNKDNLERNGLFITPSEEANIRDIYHKRVSGQLYVGKLGPDMIPTVEDGSIDCRPSKSLHTLRLKYRDFMTSDRKCGTDESIIDQTKGRYQAHLQSQRCILQPDNIPETFVPRKRRIDQSSLPSVKNRKSRPFGGRSKGSVPTISAKYQKSNIFNL